MTRPAASSDEVGQKRKKKRACQKTNRVRERLQELFPDVLFVKDIAQLCHDWDADLSRLPFCTDIYIERFLRAAKYDVEDAVLKLQHCIVRRRAAMTAQSAAVEATVRSNRFRYIGHSRGGAVVLCVDCLWGKFLDVEGGLDTVMHALEVFCYRTLWPTLERDIGRKAALSMPRVSVLVVGGTPPVSFARAAAQFFSDQYPDGLALVVVFETNSFRGILARAAFRFLPKGSQYRYTTDRAELLEILDLEDGYIPDHILYIDVSPAQQLATTAVIDREWGRELRDHGNQVCTKTAPCVVKNTFVEVTDADATNETLLRRDRAYSDDDWWEREREPDSEPPISATDEANGGQTRALGNGPDRRPNASTTDGSSLLGRQLESIVWKSSKPKNSNKRQVSGFTRRRRKQAMQKLQGELDPASLPGTSAQIMQGPPTLVDSANAVAAPASYAAPLTASLAANAAQGTAPTTPALDSRTSVGKRGLSTRQLLTVNASMVLSNVKIAMQALFRKNGLPWLLLALLVMRRALRRRFRAT